MDRNCGKLTNKNIYVNRFALSCKQHVADAEIKLYFLFLCCFCVQACQETADDLI